MAWPMFGEDDESSILEYLGLNEGLLGAGLGTGGNEGYYSEPPLLRDGFMEKFAANPLAAFGMGVLANNSGPYGQAGPAIGKGFASMQASTLANQRAQLQRQNLLAKYRQQQLRDKAIDDLDIPEEQKSMLRADPAAGRMALKQYYGWDADSPAAHAQKLARAKAGASSVSVGGPTVLLPKEAETLGKEIPGRILDELKIGRDKVASGLASWHAWQRIEQAANNGAFVGPMADKRVGLAQVGDWMGVTGKDTAEKLSATRTAIQGFAELALNSRELLKGQGQITEKEQELAARAMSGDINELSPNEVVTLARLGRRAALVQAQEHNRRIDEFASRDPVYARIAEHYKTEIPRHMWQTPTEKARASLKAARHSKGYVDAFRRQFGPWTDEILAEP